MAAKDTDAAAVATTAAGALARRLAEAGVRHVFGMPGGEVLTLIEAMRGAGIDFVLAKHENAAAFMAEAAHHATGAPGVMVATLGPGALNGVNAVANAHQDRVPLIVLTGCVDAGEAESYTHQVLDQQAVFRPITKASLRLTAEAAHLQADKAVALALEPRAGPVHVDVPISVAGAQAGDAPVRRVSASPVAPAPGAALDEARAWLAEARRPLAIVGLDVMAEGGGSAIETLCARHGIAWITTYKAKGQLDEDRPLALGAAGLSPLADRHLMPVVDAADLILCLGYDPIEMRSGWRAAWDPARQRVIDIAHEPNRHWMHQAGLAFTGHVAASLAAIAEGVEPRPTWQGGEIGAARRALQAAFPTDEAWGPAAVIDEARRALPDDTMATVDSGAHRILLSQIWDARGPRRLLQSSGLCTMGCALPLAIGAALTGGGGPVVAFTGDAGLLMVAGELATAAELGLPVIVVVFVDASLALIEKKQRERQLPNAGVDFGRHDYAALARAFGGEGHRVDDRAGLRAALEAALSAPTFTVIAADLPERAYDGRI